MSMIAVFVSLESEDGEAALVEKKRILRRDWCASEMGRLLKG